MKFIFRILKCFAPMLSNNNFVLIGLKKLEQPTSKPQSTFHKQIIYTNFTKLLLVVHLYIYFYMYSENIGALWIQTNPTQWKSERQQFFCNHTLKMLQVMIYICK